MCHKLSTRRPLEPFVFLSLPRKYSGIVASPSRRRIPTAQIFAQLSKWSGGRLRLQALENLVTLVDLAAHRVKFAR
jgi:hypothetical protein